MFFLFDSTMEINIKPGVQYTSVTKACEANSAKTLGSGDMDVFATPAMVALMENAAMNAVKDLLPDGFSTVGIEMKTSHIKATPLETEVKATAILKEIEGRKLVFNVSASDSYGDIGAGEHVRFIVEKIKFLNKIKK